MVNNPATLTFSIARRQQYTYRRIIADACACIMRVTETRYWNHYNIKLGRCPSNPAELRSYSNSDRRTDVTPDTSKPIHPPKTRSDPRIFSFPHNPRRARWRVLRISLG